MFFLIDKTHFIYFKQVKYDLKEQKICLKNLLMLRKLSFFTAVDRTLPKLNLVKISSKMANRIKYGLRLLKGPNFMELIFISLVKPVNQETVPPFLVHF